MHKQTVIAFLCRFGDFATFVISDNVAAFFGTRKLVQSDEFSYVLLRAVEDAQDPDTGMRHADIGSDLKQDGIVISVVCFD